MLVVFDKEYLQELYTKGSSKDKKHRFQPQIVKIFILTIQLLKRVPNVMELTRYGGLHYEHLIGDKDGFSSIRINNQYRIEFKETILEGKSIAEVVNITDISNHHQ